MKLEKQVTNSELSKRLKELGVKQNSIFYWQINHLFNNNIYIRYHNEIGFNYKKYEKDESQEIYSAFTVSELGNILPELTNCSKGNIHSNPELYHLVWSCEYNKLIQFADTEADARAKMLIWLIENKHMEATNA